MEEDLGSSSIKQKLIAYLQANKEIEENKLINLALINLLIDYERKTEEEGDVEGIIAFLSERLLKFYNNHYSN